MLAQHSTLDLTGDQEFIGDLNIESSAMARLELRKRNMMRPSLLPARYQVFKQRKKNTFLTSGRCCH